MKGETAKARKETWKEKCEELEALDRKGRSVVYERQLTEQSGGSDIGSAMKNRNGNLLTEKNDINDRWKQCNEIHGSEEDFL